MSALNGPFSGDVKSAPSPTAVSCGNKFETSQLNQPEDTSVLKTVFYDETENLKGSPAALDTPHGTSTSVIGKNPYAK